MQRGDILLGEKTIHPIIFLRLESSDQLIGCIITHSNSRRYGDNIKMSDNHFEDRDEQGKTYSIKNESSYFVAIELIKENDYGPFVKAGKLSPIGIQYVESHLKSNQKEKWDDYILRSA
jgi:hypothetical protein